MESSTQPRGHPETGVHVHSGGQAPIPQAPAEKLIDTWRGNERNEAMEARQLVPAHDSSMAVVLVKMNEDETVLMTSRDTLRRRWLLVSPRHQLQHFSGATVWFEPLSHSKYPGWLVPLGTGNSTTWVIDVCQWLWTNRHQPMGETQISTPGSNAGRGHWSSRWNLCPEAEWICEPGRVPSRSAGAQLCPPLKRQKGDVLGEWLFVSKTYLLKKDATDLSWCFYGEKRTETLKKRYVQEFVPCLLGIWVIWDELCFKVKLENIRCQLPKYFGV